MMTQTARTILWLELAARTELATLYASARRQSDGSLLPPRLPIALLRVQDGNLARTGRVDVSLVLRVWDTTNESMLHTKTPATPANLRDMFELERHEIRKAETLLGMPRVELKGQI